MEEIENLEKDNLEKQRGGCLTSFLILLFVVNPVAAIMNLVLMFSGVESLTEKPLRYDESLFMLAILSFINLSLAISVWKWKRIGIYGIWISSIIILMINMYLGHSIGESLLGVLGPLTLTILVIPKWQDFK